MKNDQTLYLEVQATDPNGEVQEARSLPRIVRYVFVDAPTKVKVKCDDGDNVATISWKAVKNARRYAIYMSTNGKCPSEPIAYTKKDSGDTKYVKKNLSGPKTYTFFVKAMFFNSAATTGGTGGSATKFWTVSKASEGAKLKISDRLLGVGIRPIKWVAKTNYSGTLYSSVGCKKSKGTISKGTKLYVTAKYPKKIPQDAHPAKFQVELRKNGKVVKKGWMKYGPVRKVSGEVAYIKKHAYDYSTSAKENFVNKKGYSSSTEYLCWVNTYTQRVNIFKGKKGKWKLDRTYRVTSGTFYHLTVLTPNQTIHKHMIKRVRQFVGGTGHYYMKYLSFFSKGNSFHSHCWRMNGTQLNHVKENLQPGTKGCMRMSVEDSKWIFYTIPMKTRVVTY